MKLESHWSLIIYAISRRKHAVVRQFTQLQKTIVNHWLLPSQHYIFSLGLVLYPLWLGMFDHIAHQYYTDSPFKLCLYYFLFQSDYKDSCGWEILNTVPQRLLLPPNDTNPVVVLSFELNLQRKIVFSSYILTLPCIFLAFLTLVVFWLPPERPDRTGLGKKIVQ